MGAMNTLPENELFSAYLDGELTAAEQAQMDHLLAANPAARQLLDELRTLSAALQSLPQQKVGEDLGPRVLRIAERRMLTGEPPVDVKQAQFAAVPLARSIFRRFLQPRAVVWLSITAVVAAMIMLNERRHPAPMGEKDREVALAPATPKRALPPSSMSAAPDALAKTTDSKPAELKRENGGGWKEDKAREYLKYDERPAAAAPAVAPPAEQAAEKPAGPPPDRDWAMAKKPASGPGEAAMPRPSAPGPAAETSPLDIAGKLSDYAEKPPAFAGKAGTATLSIGGEGESAAPKLAVKKGAAPAKNAPPAGKDGGRPGFYEKGITQTEQDAVAEQTDAGKQGRHGGQIVPAVGDGVLVVRCDVSPEALNKKAFDKLLEANGIAWREEEAEEEAEKVRGTRVLAEKAASDKKSAEANLREKREEQQPEAGRKMRQSSAAGPLDLVYVEATPAQIEATLAGLAAQPNVFLSVSVQPAPGEASQKSLSQYNRRGGEQSKSEGGHDDGYRAKAAPRLPEKAAQSDVVAADAMQTLGDGQPAVNKPGSGYAQRIPVPGGTLNKSGPDAQTLNGANTYSGSTAVNGGALKLGKKPEAKKDLERGQTTEGVAGGLGGGLARTQPKSQPMPGGGNKAGADQSVGRRDAPAKQPGAEELRQEAKSADEQRLSQQFQTWRAGDLAQTQRVLFVLRVVDGTGPAAAAARIRAAEVDAARQAAEPAAEPVQQQKSGH
jgi:autotransporter-associated beta strand protein